jgi:hypothetical protein
MTTSVVRTIRHVFDTIFAVIAVIGSAELLFHVSWDLRGLVVIVPVRFIVTRTAIRALAADAGVAILLRAIPAVANTDVGIVLIALTSVTTNGVLILLVASSFVTLHVALVPAAGSVFTAVF